MRTLARAGYALAGALVALLAAWLVSQVVPPEQAVANIVASLAAPTAVLMTWAALKPSRGSKASSAAEAALVTAAMVVGAVAGGSLPIQDASVLLDPANLLAAGLLLMLLDGEIVAVPIAWMLGSSERWARRPWSWAVGELVVAFTLAVLGANEMFFSLSGLQALPPFAFLLFASGLAFGAAIQRLFCGIVWHSRGEREPAPRHVRTSSSPQGAHADERATFARQARVVALVASVGASVLAIAFFFLCRHYALSQGLGLRNIVYEIPSVCILATCFVVVPVVAVGAARCPSKDYQVAGCAVLSALVLMIALFFTVFRLDAPEEAVLPDGTIEVTTPVWLDKSRVTHAVPVGLFFMRELAEAPAVAQDEFPTPPSGQSGHSYHNTGSIVSIDPEARVLVLAVSESTEGIPVATQVTVECASAEHFDVPLDELAVGDAVQIRSTEPFAGGVIVAQKVFEFKAAAGQQSEGAETLDEALEACGCDYAVSGTVTSAIDENGFSFRVDDGGGFIENGTELRVSTAFVERRLYGMKGLQWGMDGVVIGFSDMPAEGVLRAKVIAGNDDTSSDYWENMPPA